MMVLSVSEIPMCDSGNEFILLEAIYILME